MTFTIVTSQPPTLPRYCQARGHYAEHRATYFVRPSAGEPFAACARHLNVMLGEAKAAADYKAAADEAWRARVSAVLADAAQRVLDPADVADPRDLLGRILPLTEPPACLTEDPA
jgi:hypothetical protein